MTEAAAGGEYALTKATWERFGASVTAVLEDVHRDNSESQGRRHRATAHAGDAAVTLPVFVEFLQRLAKGGSVVIDGAAVRSHATKRRRSR